RPHLVADLRLSLVVAEEQLAIDDHAGRLRADEAPVDLLLQQLDARGQLGHAARRDADRRVVLDLARARRLRLPRQRLPRGLEAALRPRRRRRALEADQRLAPDL